MTNRAIVRVAIATVVCTLLGAGPSFAQYETVELSVAAGIQFGGDLSFDAGDTSIESGPSVGILAGIRVSKDALAIISYHRQITEIEVDFDVGPKESFDVDIGYLQVGGEIDGQWWPRVRPFAGITIGGTHFSPHDGGADDEWFFSSVLYGGAKIRIFDRVGIRTQIRVMGTVIDNDSEWFCVSNRGCVVDRDADLLIQGDASVGLYVTF